MKSKTIMLVGWYFRPTVGGVETIMLDIARCLNNKNYQVIVLTSKQPRLSELDYFEGITILRKDFIDSKVFCSEDKVRKGFSEVLTKYQPSILHFHNSTFPFPFSVEKTVAMVQTAKEFSIPVIEHSHDPQYRDIYLTGATRNLEWDSVLCVSDFVKTSWKVLGNRAKHFEVIYNGIDLSIYDQVKPNSELQKLKNGGDKIIFFPGRDIRIDTGEIILRKNFPFVLKACQKLLRKGINNFKLLTISYEDSNNGKVQRSLDRLNGLVKEYNLEDKVIRVPKIEPWDMPKYYSASDIICVPSLYEAFGLVFIESMASGKVTIAGDQAGPKEFIMHGETGFLVNPYEVDELAFVLAEIIRDPVLADQVGEKAKKAAKEFSSEKMCEKIEKEYLRILTRSIL